MLFLTDKIAQASFWAYKLSFRYEAERVNFKLRA